MSETEVAAAAPSPETPTKKSMEVKGTGSTATKKPKAKPTHPKTADMVTAAIKSLKERGGSSLQAIKKYIGANYKADAEKMAPFIRKYLKSAVTSGSLVQTKGKGASGSFKLSTASEKPTAKKKTMVKSAATNSVQLKANKAKAVSVKNSASSVPKKVPAKEKPEKPAAPSKAKKVKKAPTKKPKAPKPKTVGPTKLKSPNKASASKKN